MEAEGQVQVIIKSLRRHAPFRLAQVKLTHAYQDLSLGLFRSDYMLHLEEARPHQCPELKQVEFNTYSTAGGVHSDRIAKMHQYTELQVPNKRAETDGL